MKRNEVVRPTTRSLITRASIIIALSCAFACVFVSCKKSPDAKELDRESQLHAMHLQNHFINLYEKYMPATVTIVTTEGANRQAPVGAALHQQRGIRPHLPARGRRPRNLLRNAGRDRQSLDRVGFQRGRELRHRPAQELQLGGKKPKELPSVPAHRTRRPGPAPCTWPSARRAA